MRQLVVDQRATIADARRGPTGAGRRHARAGQRLVADHCERDDSLLHRGFLSDYRLEGHLHQLVAEILFLEEVQKSRKALHRFSIEVPADRNANLAGNLADVLDDPVERPLAAAQRPHPVVRVAVTIERDLHVAQAQRKQPIDQLLSQEQAIRDDPHLEPHATLGRHRVGAVCQIVERREVYQRFAAEKRDGELFGFQLVHSRLDPRGHLLASVRQHLGGGLVVVAVVALEAVVARKIALQRGQDGDAELARIVVKIREKLVERRAVGLSVLHDEPMFGQRDQCLALVHVQQRGGQAFRRSRYTVQ